jgi:multidrug resistance protein
MFKNPTLLILSLVMVVNAMAYGIIIPLLYPYAIRFGIGPLGLSLLFASFSVAQFIATPIIGRLSDKYGRKPLLLMCLFGTGLSLAMFATAGNFLMLLVSRVIDGVTGGNISVAQAVVADTTSGKDRAKAFGMIGAAFGFGFLVGPAIGGILSPFGLTVPFWFAAGLSWVGTLLGIIFLKETLPKTQRLEAKREPMFNFKSLYTALRSPTTGLVLGLSFITMMTLNIFFLGFQSFTVDVLALPPSQIAMLFAMFGLVSMLMQLFGLKYVLKWIPSNRAVLFYSLAGSAVVLLLLSLTRSLVPFTAILFFHMIFNAPPNPVLTALISERTNEEDQGAVLGINQSFVSLGQIVGPLIGGLTAARLSVPAVFIVTGLFYALSAALTRNLTETVKTKTDL